MFTNPARLIGFRYIITGINTVNIGLIICGLAIVLLGLYEIALLIGIFFSWMPPRRQVPFSLFIAKITEPVFGLLRKAMPFLRIGMIDLSPVIVFILVDLLRTLIVSFGKFIS